MRLKQLLARQAGILHKVQEIEKAAAGGPLTPTQRAELKALHAESTQLAEDIAEARATVELERSLMARQPTDASQLEVERQNGGASSDMSGFSSLGDFALAIRAASLPAAQRDPRLAAMYAAAPSGYHSETGDAGEGYLVPAGIRGTIFRMAFPGDDLLSLMSPEPTENSNVLIANVDETTPWGSSGVQAKWRTEASQMTATNLKFENRRVALDELYVFVTATEELLRDGPRFENHLMDKASAAIRWKASEALVNGTGAGQPLGWMQSGALVTVSKDSSQTAATITALNILNMYSRLIVDDGAPFWLANRNTLPQIATMTIGNQPIWTPPVSGLKQAPNGTLLGLPIIWSEHCSTLGTKGDIQLVNPAGYFAVFKQDGVSFDRSMHMYFDYGLQAFRWMFRLGGQPYLSAAVSPNNGSASKSHFVTLETRS
jgi:HK97 family phage major capsid protein